MISRNALPTTIAQKSAANVVSCYSVSKISKCNFARGSILLQFLKSHCTCTVPGEKSTPSRFSNRIEHRMKDTDPRGSESSRPISSRGRGIVSPGTLPRSFRGTVQLLSFILAMDTPCSTEILWRDTSIRRLVRLTSCA